MEKINKNKLTEGSVLRSLITLSVPIILASILQATYQLTDTFWVGRLGTESMAAVSISFPVIFLLVSFGAGLTMAGAILVAQYKGKGDQEAINHISGQALLMVFLVSFLLSIVGYFFSPYLIKLMGAEKVVFLSAVSYLKISFLGTTFMFIYFSFQALMRGVGNVKFPMYIVFGTVLLNLILDPLFIFGYGPIPAFGVAGAALVTVITQGLAALVGLSILFLGKRGIYININKLKFDFPLIKKMFFLGFPSSVEHSARSLGMIVMTFLVAGFGTVTIAAYGIGIRILSFIVIPSLGLSMATSTLVGQNMGAGKIDRAERVAKISAIVGFSTLTLAGVFTFIFAKEIVALFIPGEIATIQLSSMFLRIMSLSFGFIGIHQVLNGVFRGAGDTLTPMVLSIIFLWGIHLPLAYILSKYTSLAEVGIWIAYPISNVVIAFLILIWFIKGSWKKKKITEEIKILEKIKEEVIIEEDL